MNQAIDYLSAWREICCVNGYSKKLTDQDLSFSNMLKNCKVDENGNFYIFLPSNNPNAKTVLMEAHRDEIGLCIQKIHKDGFLSVSPCGGFDCSILPGTEFIFFGKKNVRAVACSIPPHLMKKNGEEETINFENLYFDTGLSDVDSILSIGDVGSFASPVQGLCEKKICAPGLDNKAGVLALEILFSSLKGNLENNLYLVLSSGEETGFRGIRSFSFLKQIDYAFVIDAGFALQEGTDVTACIQMGDGPSVSFSDTTSLPLNQHIMQTARENNIPLQVIAEPQSTGTNAMALSIMQGGIPCSVISIPVSNMHTASEIASLDDIHACADLLIKLSNATFAFGGVAR